MKCNFFSLITFFFFKNNPMDIQDENLLLAINTVSKFNISNFFLLIYFSTKQKLSSETLKCFIIISLLQSRWLLVKRLLLINFFWPKINQLFVLFIDRLYPIILVMAPFPVHNPIPARFFFPYFYLEHPNAPMITCTIITFS